VCARRFAGRIGRPLTPADIQLTGQIDALYRQAAVDDPRRYTVLDAAGMTPQDTAGAVQEIVTTLLDRQAAHAS
jgi:dTMP kinase